MGRDGTASQKHPRAFRLRHWGNHGERQADVAGVSGSLRPGFYVHVVQHCVANRAPNPGRSRMLVETAPGRRRLFRPGDYYHPEREGAKTTPSRENLPNGYNGLLSWYRDWCSAAGSKAQGEDPLLALRGSGKQLWAHEHADEYVRRLREGWE